MGSNSYNSIYHCQRCRLPLVLHESLSDISSTQLGLLIGSNENQQDWQGRRTVYGNQSSLSLEESYNDLGYLMKQDKFSMEANPGESFVVLTNSLVKKQQQREKQNGFDSSEEKNHSIALKMDLDNARGDIISPVVTAGENLFEILSSKGDVDYPICSDCAELAKEELGPKYEESCRERDTYISFLNKIKDQPVSGSEEFEEITKEVARLEEESKAALKELKAAEQEQLASQKELEMVQGEAEALAEEERQFYQEQNKLTAALEDALKEKDRVDSLAEYHTAQLQRLQKVNVYNDVFCIGHDGYFGTINGLRLGRLKDKKVEWPEINAAWGQTLLLLATVIHRLKFKLIGYRLRPLGSMSRIEKLEIDPKTGQPGKPVTLELYSSGDYSFERILNHKRLDSAMVAFLHILRQVGEFVESCDPSLKLPYVIDKDKIGGYSIRLSLASSNESWTIACKYVLTNSKWILAYASSQ